MALKLTVKSARNLLTKGGRRPIAPHCVIQLDGKVLKKTTGAGPPQEPQWNQSCWIDDRELKDTSRVRVEVWDWYSLDDSDFIGLITIDRVLLGTQTAMQTMLPLRQRDENSTTGGSLEILLEKEKLLPVADVNAPKSSEFLDKALVSSQSVPKQPNRDLFVNLLDVLKSPAEIDKKEKFLIILSNFAKDDVCRLIIGELEGIFDVLLKLLNREDYLYNDTHKTILSLVATGRNPTTVKEVDRLRLEKLKIKLIEVSLSWLIRSLTTGDLNASYIRTVTIVRCCASVEQVRVKLFNEGVHNILFEKMKESSLATFQESLHSALCTLAINETIRTQLLKQAAQAVREYLDREPGDTDDEDETDDEPEGEEEEDGGNSGTNTGASISSASSATSASSAVGTTSVSNGSSNDIPIILDVEDNLEIVEIQKSRPRAKSRVPATADEVREFYRRASRAVQREESEYERQKEMKNMTYNYRPPPRVDRPSSTSIPTVTATSSSSFAPYTPSATISSSPQSTSPTSDIPWIEKSPIRNPMAYNIGSPRAGSVNYGQASGVRLVGNGSGPTTTTATIANGSASSVATISSSSGGSSTPNLSSSTGNGSSNNVTSISNMSSTSSETRSRAGAKRVPLVGAARQTPVSYPASPPAVSSLSSSNPGSPPVVNTNGIGVSVASSSGSGVGVGSSSGYLGGATGLSKPSLKSSISSPDLKHQQISAVGRRVVVNSKATTNELQKVPKKLRDPSALAALIVALEEIDPTGAASSLLDIQLDRQIAFLPNKKNKIWQKDADVEEEMLEVGVNDAVFFSMLFSGTMTPDIIKQLTEEQLYFYTSFLIQYDRRAKRSILRHLQWLLNKNDTLARHTYFLDKVTRFWSKTGISTWRASPILERTLNWLEDTLQFGTGKTKLQKGQEWDGLDLVDPLGIIKGKVTCIRLEKIFTSNARPMLINLNPHTPLNPREYPDQKGVLCIFKRGDDLRKDYAVQTMFFIFNRLWMQSPLVNKPEIYQYKILPMGKDVGVMEFVQNCIPAGKFDWKILQSLHSDYTKLKRFFCTMIGSYLACWVLGIRDRHQDNMMIKDSSVFFHIDFGFIFNDAPGFDAPIFSIPSGFRKNITNDHWGYFLKHCGDAFAVLHQNAGLIINACTTLTADLPNLTSEQVRRYLVRSLMVGLSEKEAKHKIRGFIVDGTTSTQKEMKYLMHDLAVKMKT